MPNQILLYIGAALPFLWGISHLFPTASVVKGFGNISADNKNIITMEYIFMTTCGQDRMPDYKLTSMRFQDNQEVTFLRDDLKMRLKLFP